jgi:hypothetical protein
MMSGISQALYKGINLTKIPTEKTQIVAEICYKVTFVRFRFNKFNRSDGSGCRVVLFWQ